MDTMASDAATSWRCSWPATLPGPRMLVFGAIDFAAAVARVGAFLGYQVTVCDARSVFATPNGSPRRTR
jgi:xanthine dehydrogenase accessory factor